MAVDRVEAGRPREIAWFERLVFASLALGVVQIFLEREARLSLPLLSGFGLTIILTLLVARRRSKVAMGVSIALFALGIPLTLWLISSGRFHGVVPITAAQTLLQLVAYSLLFMPDAQDWLDRRAPRAFLRDTFS